MNEQYNHFVDFMDLLLDAICVVNPEGRLVFASAACEKIFGYTPKEMLGIQLLDLVHPDDKASTLALAQEINKGAQSYAFENRYIRKDGQIVYIRWSARWSEKDKVRVGIAHDITESKRAEAKQQALYAISEAAHSVEDLTSLFPRIHHIIGKLLPAQNFFVALYDRQKDQLHFPYFVDEYDDVPAPRRLNSGTLSAEVIRTGLPLLITPETELNANKTFSTIVGTSSHDWLGVPLLSGKIAIGALVVQSYSGDIRYTEQDKELLQFVSSQVASAITRTQMHERLIHAAGHDPLTGLANRGLFEDRLKGALARVRRNPARFALLYIDLDKFKEVNDSHGHFSGDRVLKEVAIRLLSCVRESDTVARIGGDEFVLLLNSIIKPSDAQKVADKIRSALNQPIEHDGKILSISPSIGIAIYPDNGERIESLLHYADNAMYTSKKASN